MDLNRPIPHNMSIRGWQNVPVIENNEKMVLLNTFAPEYISVSPQYFSQGIPHAKQDQYVRETVANKLVDVAKKLPKSYKLLVWDAWRPIEVQKALFDNYYKIIKDLYNYSDEKANWETQKYVSFPTIDIKKPSPHFTGGAIDLTIIGENSNPINMGTNFDFFDKEAHTDFFETPSNLTSNNLSIFEMTRHNRRMLFNAMINSDFTNYPNEWWHFDYGNQFWAVQKKCFAVYSGINQVNLYSK